LIATAGGNEFTVYSKKIDVIYPRMVRRYEQVPTKADHVMVSNMGRLFVKASIAIWFEYS
jgi:hypothetical protein